MNKYVKYAIGGFIGLMLINGCTHTFQDDVKPVPQQTQTQRVNTVCQYETNVHTINGSGSGTLPSFKVGDIVKFNTGVMVGSIDADGIYTGFFDNGKNKAVYKIDLKTFDKEGWDKVTNKDNYYQIDDIQVIRVSGLEALNAGVPNIDDVNKVYTLRTITAHAVHHHTQGDK